MFLLARRSLHSSLSVCVLPPPPRRRRRLSCVENSRARVTQSRTVCGTRASFSNDRQTAPRTSIDGHTRHNAPPAIGRCRRQPRARTSRARAGAAASVDAMTTRKAARANDDGNDAYRVKSASAVSRGTRRTMGALYKQRSNARRKRRRSMPSRFI